MLYNTPALYENVSVIDPADPPAVSATATLPPTPELIAHFTDVSDTHTVACTPVCPTRPCPLNLQTPTNRSPTPHYNQSTPAAYHACMHLQQHESLTNRKKACCSTFLRSSTSPDPCNAAQVHPLSRLCTTFASSQPSPDAPDHEPRAIPISAHQQPIMLACTSIKPTKR
jgi:hypothetical protein